MTAVAEEFVATCAGKVRLRRTGSGPPLLLINGIGGSMEMLDPLVRHLDGHELLAIDLPGCGRSEPPKLPLRMRHIAATVAEVLETAGHAQVDVLGYSFGGAVAQELAYRHSDRVRRLLLCGTTPGIPAVPPNPQVAAMMLTPARYYSKGLGRYIVPRMVGGRSARDEAVLREGLELRQLYPPSLLGYSLQLFAITGWSSQAYLHRIAPETLVLHGDDDPLAPLVNARYMAWRIPRARLRVLHGAGHLFLVDEPALSARLIQGFLAD